MSTTSLLPLQTLATPFQSLTELADLLENRALDYEQRRDSRCVFTLAYSVMTRRLASAQRNTDVDWQWIEALAFVFAQRYLTALDAHDQKLSPPPAWAHVFGTITSSRTSVLEDLVFPMSAHIVRDLPHALCDLGLESLRPHLREFHLVNDLMESTIGDIQELVRKRYGPFTGWLDQFAGGVDELLTNFGIRVMRATAWYNANRLLDPESSDEAARSIERSPRILVETVMSPPMFSLALLLRASRFISALVRRWPGRGERVSVARRATASL